VKRTAVLIAAALLLAACGSSSPTAEQGRPTGAALDAIFLNAAKTDAPSMDDATLLRVGHIVCEQYAKDPNPSVTTWLIEIKALILNGFTAHQAGAMNGAATGAYCPQFSKYAPTP
jgi:hypothetical protein